MSDEYIKVEIERIRAASGVKLYTQADLDSARTEAAAEMIERAAKLVCGYCDGHFPQWNRQAERGVSGSGNWVHGMKDAPDRLTLCAATGIYNKLEFDRALKEK